MEGELSTMKTLSRSLLTVSWKVLVLTREGSELGAPSLRAVHAQSRGSATPTLNQRAPLQQRGNRSRKLQPDLMATLHLEATAIAVPRSRAPDCPPGGRL